MSDVDIPVLPEGTRLIHIGPHKTGTTSLQGALWTAPQRRCATRASSTRAAHATPPTRSAR